MVKSTNKTELAKKCLDSGLAHYTHLERWLIHFHKNHFFIIDSDSFKNEPLKYLKDIQLFFELNKIIEYSNTRIFNSKQVIFEEPPSIDSDAQKILEQIYHESNTKLFILLEKYEIQKPVWLKK